MTADADGGGVSRACGGELTEERKGLRADPKPARLTSKSLLAQH